MRGKPAPRPRVGMLAVPPPKPWAASARSDDCPVDAERQRWIENSMRWFGETFGTEPLKREPTLPVPEFLPSDFSGTEPEIHDLVRRVCRVMEVDFDTVDLVTDEHWDAVPGGRRQTVGHYQQRGERHLIRLDARMTRHPQAFTAVIAHELAHARLLGEHRTRQNYEKLTDLLTVFFGMGVFGANSAGPAGSPDAEIYIRPLANLTDRELLGGEVDPTDALGYLNAVEFGYAMACYATLRGEGEPPWSRHLRAAPRRAMLQGLRFLDK